MSIYAFLPTKISHVFTYKTSITLLYDGLGAPNPSAKITKIWKMQAEWRNFSTFTAKTMFYGKGRKSPVLAWHCHRRPRRCWRYAQNKALALCGFRVSLILKAYWAASRDDIPPYTHSHINPLDGCGLIDQMTDEHLNSSITWCRWTLKRVILSTSNTCQRIWTSMQVLTF